MIRKLFCITLFSITFIHFTCAQEINKSVYSANRGADRPWLTSKDNHRALYRIITDEAFSLLEERERVISSLSSQGDWKNYQAEIKNGLCTSLSKFEKTPLNAQITGTLERETFTVEKVLFESHPGFYITAALFLPNERQNPAPTVIYASGHTALGFRSETYQHVILNLVNKGFIVLAFDPPGQGERFLYPDAETGESQIGGPTTEHSYAGAQTLLTGSSLSDYFIWDGVRVLDYLETRDEVDMERIGITGRSGGGTQTAMISACDERIYAAAPECYITSFKRLLQSIGPQDAEQNPYHAIKKGIDHPDFIHARAPKPTLMITTTHDFFSIQGARETFAEVQKSYKAFGEPGNIKMVEDLGVHESTKNNREALYAFFQEHLKLPGDNSDMETNPFSIEELQVTPTGQAGTSFDAETVFSLNKKYFSKKKITEAELPGKMIELAGIEFNRTLTAAVYTGKFSEDGKEVKKYFLENNREDYTLPVYFIKKEQATPEKLMVWLHPEGKEQLLEEPLLEELLDAGYAVVSADLPGIGELHDPEFSGDGFVKGIPFNYTFGANLAGKSIPGIQAEATDLLMQFTRSNEETAPLELHALATGSSTQVLMHYAVAGKPFKKTVLVNPLENAENLIETEFYDPAQAFSLVPGSIPFYGIPDLISLLPGGTVKIFHPKKTDENSDGEKEIHRNIIRYLNSN